MWIYHAGVPAINAAYVNTDRCSNNDLMAAITSRFSTDFPLCVRALVDCRRAARVYAKRA